jgi:hypothetical protein
LHVYASGGQGFSMRDNGKPVAAWRQVLAAWLGVSSPRR